MRLQMLMGYKNTRFLHQNSCSTNSFADLSGFCCSKYKLPFVGTTLNYVYIVNASKNICSDEKETPKRRREKHLHFGFFSG